MKIIQLLLLVLSIIHLSCAKIRVETDVLGRNLGNTISRRISSNNNGTEKGYNVLSDASKLTCVSPNRERGSVKLKPAFVDKLSRKMAFLRPSKKSFSSAGSSGVKEEEKDGINVYTSYLTKSTKRHVDYTNGGYASYDDTDRKPTKEVQGRVGFVLLNSNPDAHFDYGDMSFPIVEGNFIHFDGLVPHNTIINSGTVEMIGPFEATSFGPVGVDTFEAFNDEEEEDSIHKGWIAGGIVIVVLLVAIISLRRYTEKMYMEMMNKKDA